jgi:hypothetical protein
MVIELEDAITTLGGSLTPSQILKVQNISENRTAVIKKLSGPGQQTDHTVKKRKAIKSRRKNRYTRVKIT